MGIIRILLALAVVSVHAGGPIAGVAFFGNGVTAVELFFILSGFYMALVLRTKYRGQARRFYLARLIRLLPIYWILLGLSLAASTAILLLTGHATGLFYGLQEALPHGWLYPAAALANLFIVGSDALLLYGDLARQPTGHLLALPVVWSLAVELLFYGLAPFLLRWRPLPLVAGFLLLLALRCLLWLPSHGSWTPWNYFFAPSALHLFLLGVLAYLAYEKLQAAPRCLGLVRVLGWPIFFGLIANILFYQKWGVFHLQDYRFYFLFAASLPVVFVLFRAIRIDRAIGDYAYPLYLAHDLVFPLPRRCAGIFRPAGSCAPAWPPRCCFAGGCWRSTRGSRGGCTAGSTPAVTESGYGSFARRVRMR